MATAPTLAELRAAARKILTAFDGERTSTTWRTVVTDTESPSGFGLVCIDPEHPGIPDIGIERDEIGAYDCCPSVIETFSVPLAAYLVELLNAAEDAYAQAAEHREQPPRVEGTLTFIPDPPHVADAIRQVRRAGGLPRRRIGG